MSRIVPFVCATIFLSVITVFAAEKQTVEPKVELLWPNGAPGAQGDSDGDKPSLTICLPPQDKATDTAVVICPGGGYGHLAMDHEGQQVTKWLNSLGAASFILQYRHRNSGAGYGYSASLQDAQRAVRIVRTRAKEFGISPNRIGILGFSAGGHLASSAGTHFTTKYYESKDQIDQVNCRPDFMVLIYPVITMADEFTHRGSKHNLLGDNPSVELVENLSNEKQVGTDTPPTFLVHTFEDSGVPAENSIYFYLALRKAKVPAEMHIYQKGQHGFGLGQGQGPVSGWPNLCADWMRGLGLLVSK